MRGEGGSRANEGPALGPRVGWALGLQRGSKRTHVAGVFVVLHDILVVKPHRGTTTPRDDGAQRTKHGKKSAKIPGSPRGVARGAINKLRFFSI